MKLLRWYDSLTPRRQFVFALLCALSLMFLAAPLNLVNGYLEAEEGSTYLIYARAVSPMRAFFALHQGYYSIVPNVTMMLPARWLPLITAAWIGEWVAVLFRLSTIYFVYTCESIREARTRLVIAVLLAVLPGAVPIPGCIHTQFFLGAITAIVLLSDPQRHRISRMCALLIGGLSSPASCLFLPLFLIRAWRRKSGPAIAQALLLTACTVLQVTAVRIASQFNLRGHTHYATPWIYVDAFVSHVLLLNFLTRAPYHALSVVAARYPVLPSLLAGILGLAAFFWFVRVLWPAGNFPRKALAVGCWGIFAIYATTSSDPTIVGGSERYYIAVSTCVVIALASAWEQYRRTGNERLRRITTVLLCLVAFSGVFDIVRYFRVQQQPQHWAAQVADWKSNPRHVFRNGPWFWDHPFYLPEKPLHLNLPFYVFDSLNSGDTMSKIPPAWFQPLTETTDDTVPPGLRK